MPNYNYVIDSTFRPFSLQEYLVPFTAYKEVYDKQKEELDALSQTIGDFKYLEDYAEDSKARGIYEKYANDYNKQFEDFTRNGVYAGNKRALSELKRRYTGEIGRLKKAEEALKEEQKLRRTMSAQDPTQLYAIDNLTLDQFLDNSNPNLYSISGNYLSVEGAKMGEALSKRMFTTEEGATNILGGYYIDYVQRTGVKDTAAFMQSPEFMQAMKEDLASKGVYDNLSGVNLQRAVDSYRSGAMKGFVYSEQHSPQRDLGKMTAHESADLNLKNKSYELEVQKHRNQLETSGYPTDENGNIIGDYDPNKDTTIQRAIASGEIVTDEDGNMKPNTPKRVNGEKPEVEKMKDSIVINQYGQWKELKKVSAGSNPNTYGIKKDYGELTKMQQNLVDKYHSGYMKSGGYDFYVDNDGNVTIIKAKESVPKKQDPTTTTTEEVKPKGDGEHNGV